MSIEKKEGEVNTALSYSSSTLLSNCEQKYWHYKVNETPKDPDFEDNYEAFNVGKTFHEVLEKNKHTRNNLEKLLIAACKEYETQDKYLMIKAMLYSYLDMHEASGLTCVACELQISSKEVIGFVDAFLIDDKGYWYICDLKTSGRWMPSILSRLASDPQLNLYSHFAERLGLVLGLDPKKFKGCLYRVTTKTTIAQKAKESEEAYFNRLYKTVKTYDIFIPVESMNVGTIWERHMDLYNRSIELRNGEAPTRNYSYCESYFRPCGWWSNCHGDTNTNCNGKVILNTEQSYTKMNKIIKEIL